VLITDFRNKFPDIAKTNSLIEKLTYSISNNKEVGTNLVNPKLNTGKLDVSMSNELTEAFEKLLNDTNPEVVQFAKILAYIGFMQSGLNKSNISYTTVIPNEAYSPLMKDPILKFGEYLQKEESVKTLENFYKLFRRNNPNFFIGEQSFANKEPYRFKDYEDLNKFDIFADMSNLPAAPIVKPEKETTINNTNKPVFNSLPSKSSVPTMTYAGIGSRQTPQEVLNKMTEVAKYLDGLGYTLQTGFTFIDKNTGLDEEGADKAFSDGSKNKTLFGPYSIRKTVEGIKSTDKYDEAVTEKSNAIVKEVHPAPDRLTSGAIKLMARNTNQIFGKDLNNTVDFVLFYAKETSNPLRPAGGTGQAVEMARRKGIPTINLADTDWREQLKTILSTQSTTQPSTTEVVPIVSTEVTERPTVSKISRPTESKKLEYTIYNFNTNKNQTKNGYKLTIPEFPNAELYITQEVTSQDSIEGSTEFNYKSKDWSIEIVHPTKGVMMIQTDAKTKKDVIDAFVQDINEKHSKSEHGVKVLKEVGINFTTTASTLETQPAVQSAVDVNEKILSNFYNSLTAEEKDKLGLLDDIIENYNGLPVDMSVNSYIDQLKCKI
jgi:hypothetical protein